VQTLNRQLLEEYRDRGLLKSARHPDLPLTIWNYTDKVQYDRLWDDLTSMCRGLVIDDGGKIWARPFAKFFNYGEPDVVLPDEPFTVTEKLDGSLIIIFRYESADGSIERDVVASRGSFTSRHAAEGTRLLAAGGWNPAPGLTYLFELIHPEYRIIVDYGERRELVHLATIDTATGAEIDVGAGPYFPSAPTYKAVDWDDILRARPNAEGYVVRFDSGLRVKVKHDEYVRLARVMAHLSDRTIWDVLRNGESIESIIAGIPDEHYARVQRTVADFQERRETIEEATRKWIDAHAGLDRKSLALALQADESIKPEWRPVIFRMLDGKDYVETIWKILKPESGVPWWDVAA
jgi:RNA ligase